MAWIFTRQDLANGRERMLVKDEGMTKGEIVQDGAMWEVNLMMVPDLNFRNGSYERCIGYVRGVEATVNLYAKETGLADRQRKARGGK